MLATLRTNRTLPGVFLNDLFNDNLWSNFLSKENKSFKSSLPAVNVEETDKTYLISVAAPGLNKEDFHVSVENNILTISSESNNTKEDSQNNFLRREFNYQEFSRSFSLPENTNVDSITASHKNGILNVSVDKKEEKVLKTKEIKIK